MTVHHAPGTRRPPPHRTRRARPAGAMTAPPPLTVINCGAGTDSTTLTLMSAWGLLPRADAVIFADTGDEPATVYSVVDALDTVLSCVKIPFYQVSHGRLSADVLDPHTAATLPAFTLGEPAERRARGGHGVLSASGFRRGQLPRRCTPRYKAEVIDRKIRELLGAPVRTVDCRYCQASGIRLAPWNPGAGPGLCSVCRGAGQRRLVDRVPAGARVVQWIGFPAGEESRRDPTTFPAHATPLYPLIDLGWTTTDCATWLTAHGWPAVTSACVMCPYRSDEGWQAMRDHAPGDFARAVAFDHAFRTAPGLRDQRFPHPSRTPLGEAPLDRRARRTRTTRNVIVEC